MLKIVNRGAGGEKNDGFVRRRLEYREDFRDSWKFMGSRSDKIAHLEAIAR